MNVLVIEDQPPELKLARDVLSAAGHEVSAVRSAEEALEIVKRARPDVALVDLVLPGIDGLALVRMLKADPETQSIPIIAITGYPEGFPRRTALAAGCDVYL